jgi:hypothetical protein
MTDDVRRMRVSMESMADATKLQQIIRLEDRLYEFEEKLLDMEDVDKDDARKKLLKKRIRTINSHIEEISKSMNGTSGKKMNERYDSDDDDSCRIDVRRR